MKATLIPLHILKSLILASDADVRRGKGREEGERPQDSTRLSRRILGKTGLNIRQHFFKEFVSLLVDIFSEFTVKT